MMKLSVVIPVFNEKNTIEKIIAKINEVGIEKEIIIVDDCSTDGTRDILKKIKSENIKIFYHETNQGKGAALRTGFNAVKGDIVIIQDADLEYNPQDYGKLIQPILDGKADVVYGSRFLKKEYVPSPKEFFYLTHFVGNKFLNFLLNILYGTNITDMETGYKVFKKEILGHINLSAKRFEIEPEITTCLLNSGFKIYEIPILYFPRDYKEGKKISWKDGLAAAYVLVKNRFKKGDRGMASTLLNKQHPDIVNQLDCAACGSKKDFQFCIRKGFFKKT